MPILGRVRRAVSRSGFYKRRIAPLRYRGGAGYDAGRYWRDRFRRYGRSLRGSGDETLDDEANRAIYEEAARVLLEVELRAGIDHRRARVLDIGVGPGFFTQAHHDAGVGDYTGVDITDVLFDDLRARFAGYRFVRADVTAERIEGAYDLVLMIDVAEHIVENGAMDRAAGTVARALAPGGVFLVGPFGDETDAGRRLFYVRRWAAEEMRARFEGYEQLEPAPFRTGMLLGFRAPR